MDYRILLWVGAVLCLWGMPGCYSAHAFESDSADILTNRMMSNPEYRIVFRKVTARESVGDSFEFENPPPRLMACGISLDVEDARRLADHDARIRVDIHLKNGTEVLSGEIDMSEELPEGTDTVRPSWPFWIRPPIGWCDGPKGQVVPRDDRVTPRSAGSDSDKKWFVRHPDRHAIGLGAATLRWGGSYRMRVEVEVATPLDEPVSFYPVLAGGVPWNL